MLKALMLLTVALGGLWVALRLAARLISTSYAPLNGRHRRADQRLSDYAKRLFDIVFSVLILIMLSPLLLAISLIIRLTSPGPVFYRATRIGRSGQPFRLYKFRSMVVDADRRGPAITTAGDSRITPIGRVLRSTKLDELPQFINVLRGEMSLVGPRPEDPRYVALYTPEQRAVLDVRPGITSPASVYYRDEESLLSGADWERQYIEQIMPAKLKIDMDYARRGSLTDDLIIIWRTFLTMWQPVIARLSQS
jgi:lipopolysaccharide/colanic/teichoic acid biosynthesis glycosyltransferase